MITWLSVVLAVFAFVLFAVFAPNPAGKTMIQRYKERDEFIRGLFGEKKE